jgi:hypothetical protein
MEIPVKAVASTTNSIPLPRVASPEVSADAMPPVLESFTYKMPGTNDQVLALNLALNNDPSVSRNCAISRLAQSLRSETCRPELDSC